MGYSADIRMQLRFDGEIFRIAQLGPNFLMLDRPADRSPGHGEVEMWIDGQYRSWQVCLPNGIRASDVKTRLS